MRTSLFRHSILITGLLLASALPALGQDPTCPEVGSADRSRLTARIPVSEIQDDLQTLLSSGSKVLRKLDPISFSNTTGAIRLSGTLALPTNGVSGPSTDFGFNITFRPSIINKCDKTYLSLEFQRVALEQKDYLSSGAFNVVENLTRSLLEDSAVRNYVATFLSKPFGLAPEAAVELLDRDSIEVDSDTKTIRLRIDFSLLAAELAKSSRVSAGAKKVATNPTLLKELAQLRLWAFGPEITRTTGANGPGYEPDFLIEFGHGLPSNGHLKEMETLQAADRELVKQAKAADVAKYGNPATLLTSRDKLFADALAKLSAKGGAPGVLEQKKITALQTQIEADIKSGLRADNPLFTGDPEAQAKDLTASMTSRVDSLFAQLGRDREMVAVVQGQAGQLTGKATPFLEQRTSEKTLQEFLHFGDGAEYMGHPVFRDLRLSLNPVMDEVSLSGQLHMDIPGYTKGFLDAQVANGIAGVLGKYLPFRVVIRLMFTPQSELLFNLQTLSVDLPGAKDPFVIRRGEKTGAILFERVEFLLATSVVPKLMGANPTQKLVLDTLKATHPTQRGDMIVLNLDIVASPLYKFVPDQVKDLRLWRVGTHDSQSVGRKFFELAAGAGPVNQNFWEAQQKRVEVQLQRFQDAERAKAAGQKVEVPSEKPVDMQLRFAMDELKKRIDLMLSAVKPFTEKLLEEQKKQSKLTAVVIPDELTIAFPSQEELREVANKLLAHDNERARKKHETPPTFDDEFNSLKDIFTLHLKGQGHILNPGKIISFLTRSSDYNCTLEATLHLRLKLLDVKDFTGTPVRTPVYLAKQLFEIETVQGGAEITDCALGRIAGWGANKFFDLDDTDFENPRSQKLKAKLLQYIMPHLDNEKGSYLIQRSASNATAQPIHLNQFVRFFSTQDRFALQLNPRLFSPLIDLQAAHPVDPPQGQPEILFDGMRVGLRIDNSPDRRQVSLDCSMRPTLAGVDEGNFAKIVGDATALLSPMAAATTSTAFMAALRQARLPELFLKKMTDDETQDRSIVARLNRLTKIYTYLGRTGNEAVFKSPETLGTGLDTVTYAKTLIAIRKVETAVLATATRLGLKQQLMSDADFLPFVNRYAGVKADGSDSIQKERIDTLLATYRDKFLQRNQAVSASPADSDWTKPFRSESEKAQRIYNEISR